MRIALNAWFIDQPGTGSGQYLLHLLDQYAASYAEHRFLLCGHVGQKPPRVAGSDQWPACFEWQATRTPFDRSSRHLAKVWFEQIAFPLACRRWQAELAHIPYWASPLFPGIPTVVTIHDLIPVLLPAYGGGIPGRAYNQLVSQSARRATCVLTDSLASRQDIIHDLSIPAERVKAIHLAADEHFQPVRDAAVMSRVRTKYALPSRYLLYLDGFDVRKNVPGILRAFALLDIPDLYLVIGGRLPDRDSDFFPDPRRIAGELHILDRVHFAGWVDNEDAPAMYTGAAVFLFPSYYEGFGLPALEAMACGTPVIVSDRSSLPEVIGQGGLCIAPDDPHALAEAMRSIVCDTSLHEQLRGASLVQAQRFSWRKTAQETMAAYKSPHMEGGKT